MATITKAEVARAEKYVFTVDQLAEEYLDQQIRADAEWKKLTDVRDKLITLVREGGSVPPRATKTIALSGMDYEARVTEPQEISVDTGIVYRILTACASHGCRSLCFRLFRRIETFVLADDAQDVINSPRLPKGAPRNLRALFGRAVKVRALTPQLEVRKLEK